MMGELPRLVAVREMIGAILRDRQHSPESIKSDSDRGNRGKPNASRRVMHDRTIIIHLPIPQRNLISWNWTATWSIAIIATVFLAIHLAIRARDQREISLNYHLADKRRLITPRY